MASSDQSTWISQLDPNLPAGSEKLSDGDDSIRHFKKVVRDTIPNLGGAVSVTDTKLNHLDNNTYTDASQIILGVGAKADNVANAGLTVIATEINCNTLKLKNTGDPDDDLDVGNRGYNDARYYQRQEVIDLLNVMANGLYPIGSIYENGSNASNPAAMLGFGTWVPFGAGRVSVGLSSGEAEFNVIGETGGVKSVALTTAQTPEHTHTMPNHTHKMGLTFGTSGGGRPATGGDGSAADKSTASGGGGSTSSVGGGQAHTNLQPYIVVYRWIRTA